MLEFVHTRLPLLLLGIWCALFPFALGAADAAVPIGRIGFEEPFTTKDGWEVSNGAPIKSIDLNALPAAPAPKFPVGTPAPHILFTTVCGALNSATQRADWPEWPKKPFAANTTLRKQYDRTVNLDTYHYLVIDMPIRGCNVVLAVNGVSLPIAYTSGQRAYDLKIRDHANLKGLQKITLSLEFLNTSGSVGFNAIRLAASLTNEEQKSLMPLPVEYKPEKLSAHPYHHLEALNARACRARHPEYEGQLVVYRDTLSNAEVWKLTDQPGDQHFHAGDTTLGWSADGRFFQVNGGKDGKNVFDFQTGQWRKTMQAGAFDLPDYAARWDSKLHPGVVYGYRVDYAKAPDKIFRFYRFDSATGKEAEFVQWITQAKWAVREIDVSNTTDKAVVGLRESAEACVIDPDAADAQKRALPITLSTRLKGLHFGKNDTTLIWHNCYTYEQWERDISQGAAGETHLGYYTGGGHAGGGGGRSLNHYEGLTVVRPDDCTDWQAGDQVKIFAYYKHPFDTDYGGLTRDGRWWVVNGNGQDVANQILMIDGQDCATILRLAGMNTSRNDWSTNTYTLASPDGGRVAWVSDQLGDGDVYFVMVKRPTDLQMDPAKMPPVKPPEEPKAENFAHGVIKLSWKSPVPQHVFRTEIYACAKKEDPCDNTTVIGAVLAPQPQQFFDWGGGAPGAAVIYKFVSVDSRGVRSAPISLEATWPAVEKPVTIAIQTADLKNLPEGWESVTRGTEKMVAPTDRRKEDVSKTDMPVYLPLPFNLPTAGDYAIWLRYAPGYTSKRTCGVKLDKEEGRWELRSPYRPMSGTLAAPKEGAVKIFSDRLGWTDGKMEKNEFALTAGDHVLTLQLGRWPDSAQITAIQTVWITNDPSFRPPGYDPRADFKK